MGFGWVWFAWLFVLGSMLHCGVFVLVILLRVGCGFAYLLWFCCLLVCGFSCGCLRFAIYCVVYVVPVWVCACDLGLI